MRWLLVAGFGGIVMFTAVVCMVLLLVRHRVRRHHRVDPKVATEAPLSWSVDPRGSAKLHRRLAKVGTALGRVAEDHRVKGRRRNRELPPIATTALDLRRQAVALDQELTRLTLLAPGARREPLRRLAHQVDEVEAACAQVVSLSAELLAPRALTTDDPAVIEITQRVDRLAQAHAELRALDDAAGIATTASVVDPPAPATAADQRRTAEG